MDLIIEHKRAWVRQSRYDWTQFSRRIGVGPGPFAERLARARLLFLRRRDVTSHWLALALVLCLFPVMFPPSQARAATHDEIRAGVNGGPVNS